MSINAMKQALEAFGEIAWSNNSQWQADRAKVAIAALRERLAQPEQEPVAWMHNFIKGNVIAHKPADIDRHSDRWTALYKDPTPCKTCQSLAMAVMNDQTYHEEVIAKREWVGLTDEEIDKLRHLYDGTAGWTIEIFARAIEAKLKEKNYVETNT